MKLRPDQLASNLKKSLDSFYVIAGEEPFQQGECCDLVRQQARSNGFSERDLHTMETGIDWNSVAASGANMSLFGDQRIVEIRLGEKGPGREGSKVLQQLAEHPPEDTLILLSLNKLDQKAAWVKKMLAHATLVQVYPIAANQLQRWIQGRLQAVGLQASPDAIQLLAERCEGNLLSCSQEIEKLTLLFEASDQPDKLIEVSDVQFSVGDSSRYNIFDFSAAVFSGQRARALQILDGLKGEGVATPLLLWAFLSDLRKLETAQTGGRTFFYGPNKQLMEQAVRRIPHQRLEQAFRTANQIDRTIKGMEKGDPWHYFSVAVMGLTGN